MVEKLIEFQKAVRGLGGGGAELKEEQNSISLYVMESKIEWWPRPNYM